MGKKLELTNEQINDILNLNKKGLKDREIADIYQIGRTTVGKIINQHGIYRRPSLDKRVDSVMKLYNEGKNQTEIYKELHMDRKNVRKILKDHNVDVNKNSWKPKYMIDTQYFDNIDTPNKAYILGFLYADGNLTQHGYGIRLFLQDRDKNILEDILAELKSNYPLHFYDYSYKPNHRNQYGIFISNKYMFNSLLNCGLTPNKSLTLKYPTCIPDKYQKDFLRGYFDGDGTLHSSKNGKNCNFISTNDFCIVAKDIIESHVGVNCGVYQYDENGITSILQISGGKQVTKFLSWIYENSDLKLKRKYLKYRECFSA